MDIFAIMSTLNSILNNPGTTAEHKVEAARAIMKTFENESGVPFDEVSENGRSARDDMMSGAA